MKVLAVPLWRLIGIAEAATLSYQQPTSGIQVRINAQLDKDSTLGLGDVSGALSVHMEHGQDGDVFPVAVLYAGSEGGGIGDEMECVCKGAPPQVTTETPALCLSLSRNAAALFVSSSSVTDQILARHHSSLTMFQRCKSVEPETHESESTTPQRQHATTDIPLFHLSPLDFAILYQDSLSAPVYAKISPLSVFSTLACTCTILCLCVPLLVAVVFQGLVAIARPFALQSRQRSLRISAISQVRHKDFQSPRQSSKDSDSIQIPADANPSQHTPFHQDICAICLEDYKADERPCVLRQCFHMFHQDCIDRWLNASMSAAASNFEAPPITAVCPLCKCAVQVTSHPHHLADEMREFGAFFWCKACEFVQFWWAFGEWWWMRAGTPFGDDDTLSREDEVFSVHGYNIAGSTGSSGILYEAERRFVQGVILAIAYFALTVDYVREFASSHAECFLVKRVEPVEEVAEIRGVLAGHSSEQGELNTE
ncbi:hypothetical protein CcCBS67573_g08670 [Chytriomyces confervae]|uniref:RING-type domain-containing protein n=1 Tax=Chytriomyces confervae TaxID=246404 RepID=A0A507EI38_9FUNG|nr:hypothetical protein HDU80_009382 [Chytriomyces hyalinus]TPX63461.1 hypothetical protein CcCBS67573_g08670 [Chytriomyces confervae]